MIRGFMKENYYDIIADGYNELYEDEQLKKLNFAFSTALKHKPDFFDGLENALDVGCGTGISSDFFQEKGLTVVGIDPSKKLISLNKFGGKKCLLTVGQAEKIEFGKNSFDLVVSFTAIQNFDDLNKGLSEIRRVGKEKFILTCLNRAEDARKLHHAIMTHFPTAFFFHDDKDNYYICWD
jgi:ubiquinone/menaquinone biosynthesis C-methylase UbiE